MATLTSPSPEQTAALGAALAQTAAPGWVIGLIGELGAGKTQFAQGFARGLGVTERVHSPTFTLVNEYRSGRLPLYHLDLYRLESSAQIFGAGLDPYLSAPDGITLVEWFDRLDPALLDPGRLIVVRFAAPSETTRTLSYEDPRA